MNKVNPEKIYIDIDEEITTVVDHLNKAKSNNIVIIAPQHALILQSVVNLKLLAQEAIKRKKSIILMTKDEDGISFARRAGISIQPFVSEENDGLNYTQATELTKKPVLQQAEKNRGSMVQQGLDGKMGSQSFFASDVSSGLNVAGLTAKKTYPNNMIPPVHSVEQPVTQPVRRQRKQQSAINRNVNNKMRQKKREYVQQEVINSQRQVVQGEVMRENESFDEYEQSLNMARVSGELKGNSQYRESNRASVSRNDSKRQLAQKKQKIDDITMSGHASTAIKSFIIGSVILISIILFVLVLPKTNISIDPKQVDIDEAMEMTAKVGQNVYDAERRLIPARLIERDITFTKTFNATGTGNVEAQKAQGIVTIFNEYSEKPQPLVATTRFLSENGTLFRLVNKVIVPGKRGEKPGSVEALVIADKPGEVGNIGPSRFSIPGFESSPKKGKFYGVSDKSITGGGLGGDGVSIVTAGDIQKAGEEMNAQLQQHVKNQLIGLMRPDNEVLTDDSFEYEVVRSEASISEGTMAEQFMYEIVAHVKAIVFSETDVLTVMESNLAGKYQQYNEEQIEANIEYNNVKSDFKNETIEMNARGIASIVSTVDVESFKKDIIGKKHDDLLAIMEGKYEHQIEKITIDNVFPGFPVFVANRISRFEFMTDILVK